MFVLGGADLCEDQGGVEGHARGAVEALVLDVADPHARPLPRHATQRVPPPSRRRRRRSPPSRRVGVRAQAQGALRAGSRLGGPRLWVASVRARESPQSL